MRIDIDRLSEPELIDLNHRVVARLRFLHQMRAHAEMLEFRVGDRVAFHSPGRGSVEGTLARYNKRTVTVIADDGGGWNGPVALHVRPMMTACGSDQPQPAPNQVAA